MKKATLLLLLLPLFIQAQINQQQKPTTGIVKYDFATYNGKPIQKGWLFSDSTYRKLYLSYNAADTMSSYLEKQGHKLEEVIDEFTTLREEYGAKSEGDMTIILSQQENLGKMKGLLDTSLKDNAAILKQFWKIGSVRLHKGTTIGIGAGAILLGYLAGRAR